ncbi:MAG: indolepyruvate ferredoxin oxidoreductase subunit alpha [Candidatus Nitrosocaldus sp.]
MIRGKYIPPKGVEDRTRKRRNAIDLLLARKGERIVVDAPLAIIRAALESGISYAAGYPGAPTADLIDMLSESSMLLNDLGIFFESSTNEASAATKLLASVYDRIHGFVNWKVVGSNVAADVLAHITSSGTLGSAVIVVGEDYETESTTVEMKSYMYGKGFAIPVIDPIGSPMHVYRLTKHAFRLSEYSNMPVMLLLRPMAANCIGSIVCEEDIKRPEINVKDKKEIWEPDLSRYTLTETAKLHAVEKYAERIPKAMDYIASNRLNDYIKGDENSSNSSSKVGFITHGSIFNSFITAMHELGRADLTGRCYYDMLNLNVVYPIVPEEIIRFASSKDMLFIVEEGAPFYIEESIRSILHAAGINSKVYGKVSNGGFIPLTGALDVDTLLEPLARMLSLVEPYYTVPRERLSEMMKHREMAARATLKVMVARNPTFCTGCPERPIFTAVRWLDERFGRSIYAGDSGCYTMAHLPPFNASDTFTGMGTSLDAALGLSKLYRRRVIAVMGDGTFFHRGITNVDNLLYNVSNDDSDVNIIFIIFENYWTAMTGHQPNPASKANTAAGKHLSINYAGEFPARASIESILKAHGIRWIRRVNPFDFSSTLEAMLEAYMVDKGVRVIICDGECTLARMRREQPMLESMIDEGKRVEEVKYRIDEEICSGCFPCEKYSGCPSVTMVRNPNPLRTGYIKQIEDTCTGCGICGITSIFGLCPSTYRIRIVHNPTRWERFMHKLNMYAIRMLRGSSKEHDYNYDYDYEKEVQAYDE